MATFLQSTIKRMDQAGELLKLSKDELDMLKQPHNVLKGNLTIELDNGERQSFPAFRIQHNDFLGPFKGGIRFHPQVDQEEVSALALLMSLKNSAANLPYGGAKGGIEVEPRKISEREKQLLARAYVREFEKHLGPDKDIPAPDINTDSQTMAWMADEYSKLQGVHLPASFTGKPLLLGGSHGRETATSFGGVVILKQWLEQDRRFKNSKPGDISIAIQGFGNVGANAAKLLFDQGFKIVAISDSKGAIYSKSGLPIREIIEIQERSKFANKGQNTESKLQDIVDQYQQLDNSQLLELDVDVLIPAALEDQITSKNASQVKAKIILELANGPVTFKADGVLEKNNSVVLPDIIANSGGVVGSYFEWVQNRTGEQWEKAIVMEKISTKLQTAFAETVKVAKELQIDLRTASYLHSLEKLVQAMRLKGKA